MPSHTTHQIERNISENNIIKTEKKENDIEDSVFTDARFLFESDEIDYYKPIRIGNAFSKSYVEYESNAEKDKMLSTDKYLDKIRPYLSDIKMIMKTKRNGKFK